MDTLIDIKTMHGTGAIMADRVAAVIPTFNGTSAVWVIGEGNISVLEPAEDIIARIRAAKDAEPGVDVETGLCITCGNFDEATGIRGADCACDNSSVKAAWGTDKDHQCPVWDPRKEDKPSDGE